MSKDIKKALEHCIEWNCIDCPNREELGSGETVCRGRLLPEVLEYVADLEAKLAEKEKEIERLKIYDEYRFELPYPKVTILGKTFEDIQELTDKWIKQGSKDKISFAVEQLEKVKSYIITDEKDIFGANYLMKSGYVLDFIDNQIKEIKGDV